MRLKIFLTFPKSDQTSNIFVKESQAKNFSASLWTQFVSQWKYLTIEVSIQITL